jgi:hypothetical protein
MNTSEQEKHLRLFANTLIQEATGPCRITIALFT